MNPDKTFEIAGILSAIAVPLLTAIVAVTELASNVVLLRSVAFAGFLFLIAAIVSYPDVAGYNRSVTFPQAVRVLLSPSGALLAGMVTLLYAHVYQIVQLNLIPPFGG